MLFDKEKYRHHMARLALPSKQEDDIIGFLHFFAVEMISPVFGKHPVQQTKAKQGAALSGKDSAPMLHSHDAGVSEYFNALKER
jgi:hypothetical protein